jgi:nitrogen fixation NifU-like protein
MSSMAELYQSVIVAHDRRPRNFRVLDAPTARAEGHNPLCGDDISVELQVDADDRIADIAFQGNGCAISRASASLMTDALRGRTRAEAAELFEQFHALVTGGDAPSSALGKLEVFKGVAEYPMRVKCATLAWHAMHAALNTPTRPAD